MLLSGIRETFSSHHTIPGLVFSVCLITVMLHLATWWFFPVSSWSSDYFCFCNFYQMNVHLAACVHLKATHEGRDLLWAANSSWNSRWGARNNAAIWLQQHLLQVTFIRREGGAGIKRWSWWIIQEAVWLVSEARVLSFWDAGQLYDFSYTICSKSDGFGRWMFLAQNIINSPAVCHPMALKGFSLHGGQFQQNFLFCQVSTKLFS